VHFAFKNQKTRRTIKLAIYLVLIIPSAYYFSFEFFGWSEWYFLGLSTLGLCILALGVMGLFFKFS
jgi:hypothetical protein